MKNWISIIILFFISLLWIFSCSKSDEVTSSNDLAAFEADQARLLADGISKVELIATVYDSSGNLADGVLVKFATTHGTISSPAYTDEYGQARTELCSAASEQDVMATITAQLEDDVVLSKTLSGRQSLEMVVVGFTTPSKMNKRSEALGSSASIQILFIGVSLSAQIDQSDIPADGISTSQLQIMIKETTSQRGIDRALVNLRAHYVPVSNSVMTDSRGQAVVQVQSWPHACVDTLLIEYGNLFSKSVLIQLIPVRLVLSPRTSQLLADGKSKLSVIATLASHKNNPIVGANIRFTTDDGLISAQALTNNSGQAYADLMSSTRPNANVKVIACFSDVADSIQVAFVTIAATSIGINVNPNYIWVTETGNIEQSIITATINTEDNQTHVNDLGVRFVLRNGPNGGEQLLPSIPGNLRESPIITAVNGQASVTLKSGTRSGPVEIQAFLIEYPGITSRSTNVTIRSGPPYIWIDPVNPNHVESHMTLAQDYFNQEGWNHVRRFSLTLYVGDKYNNPVEEGTAIYLTSTAGIVTTDLQTDAFGEGKAIWTTANPRPYIEPADALVLAPHRIANPNAPDVLLPFIMPDFEGSLVRNSIGAFDENDGIGLVLATTHGRDQNGADAIVFSTGMAVFSGPVAVFQASTQKNTLALGEATLILIRIYDINGNPVAKGSTLSASTSAGRLSSTDLMAKPDQYGFGTTYFSTQLLNNLDPAADDNKMAEVTFSLESPNGTGTRTVYVYLQAK